MFHKIPLFKIYWDEKDINSVNKVIKSGSSWANGPQIEEFEEKIAKYLNRKFALVFNSGTSALHSLMIAYNFKKGDEIIVPSFSFMATANAPIFVNAKPIFADIEEETFGLDPSDVNKKITKNTKAIIAMHYGGSICKIKELKEIAKKHNVILIEDAAESLGAKMKNKKAGNFGDSAILSFCQNKIITTGEGGAVVTDSERVFNKLKLIRSHGRKNDERYFSSSKSDYKELGYNFRMSSILAALGLSQLEKIDKIIEKRREKAKLLNKGLKNIKDVKVPFEMNFRHVYQLYTIRVKNKEIRNNLLIYLRNKGIMSKIYFTPVHLSSFYRERYKIGEDKLPITRKISDKVLTLPIYPDISDGEIDYIIKTIKSFFN